MRHLAIVVLLVFGCSGCAGKQQLTNRQVVIGVAAVAGLVLLFALVVHQCNKGASYCDNEDSP